MKTPRPEPAVRPPRFLTDPRFGLALLLVLIVPFLVPIPMELRRHPIIGPLGNQVHVVLMGVFTLLFYWWGPLRGRLLGSALATAGLGVAIEIVQMPLGRSAAVFDVVLDLVGVAIICGWVIWRGHGRRAGLVLAVAAFLVVPYRIYDLPFEAAASYAARDSFPLLADLEGRHDRWLWLGNGARLEVATPADGPGRVVRVTSKPDSHWPGAEFRHFPHDWSAADSLLIDLRLVSGPAETQRMGIRLDDFEGRHDESWVGVGAEIGPAWTTVRIPLRDRMTRNEAGPTGRPFDLHDVDRVLVFGHRPTGPIVFEVDNVRLTLAPRTGFDLPSDDP